MRHHRLFAAGLAAALMLGAASPALAAPGKGKANAPGQTKPKPKPNNKSGVSGGGSANGGEFSIQARLKHTTKGHFNYTDPTLKVRCRGFDSYSPPAPTDPSYPRMVSVRFTNCVINGNGQTQPLITVTVTDGGPPSVTPPTPDAIGFDVGATHYGGNLTDGNVKIR